MMDQQTNKPVAYWRVILAAILDFITAIALIGWPIAAIFGQTTKQGFNLTGGPAILAIALIIAYFVLGPRFGGTVWRRILGVPIQK